MSTKSIIKRLLKFVENNQFQRHNCAENDYCPYCCTDEQWYDDQNEHNKGCKVVRLIKDAKKLLASLHVDKTR